MPGNIDLKIGDVSISIAASPQVENREATPAYLPFIAADEPDIHLTLRRGEPQNSNAKKFFGSYPIWDLYHSSGTSIIKFYDDMPGLSRSLVFDNPIKEADLYFPDSTDQFVHPFYGPVLELMMINYLARQRGTIIHSCAIKHRNNGFLFVGESGAGKSTLSRLWNKTGDIEVLSNDRTIVRKRDGAYWIYGTPWHGEAEFGSPQSVKLNRIYFIQHGAANLARRMSGAEPVQILLTCSFPPYWDSEGMRFTMDFFSDLTARVPCYELFFKPDLDIIDFVRRHQVEEERLCNLHLTAEARSLQSKEILSNRGTAIG